MGLAKGIIVDLHVLCSLGPFRLTGCLFSKCNFEFYVFKAFDAMLYFSCKSEFW